MNALDYLKKRGVTRAADRLGWHVEQWNGREVIAMPVGDEGGARDRLRAVDKPLTSSGAKTIWRPAPDGTKLHTPKIYGLPDMAAHVAAAAGVIIIATGEFDLATFIEADAPNVIAFTSETAVPDYLPNVLTRWGVERVDMWPDNDEAGRKGAAKVRDLLAGTAIEFTARNLAPLVDRKGDTNDLWQAVGFDAAEFWRLLNACAPLDLPRPEPRIEFTPRTYTGTDWPPAFVRDVTAAVWRLPNVRQRGDWITASLREDDKNPSFGFNTETLGYNDFGGDKGGIIELGRRLGIQIEDYREPEPPKPKGGKRRERHQKPRAKVDEAAQQADEPAWPPAQADQPSDWRIRAENAAKRALKRKPFHVDNVDAWGVGAQVVNARYLPPVPAGDWLLVSDTGTGKTEAMRPVVEDTVNAGGRVLIVTHRRALASGLAERLAADCYLGNDAAFWSDRQALVISIQSLPKLLEQGAEPYAVVIVDEVTQVYGDLAGATFGGKKGKRPARAALTALKQYIASAGRVLLADKDASPADLDQYRRLRPMIRALVNTFTRKRGDVLTVHQSKALLLAQAAAAAQIAPQGRPVVIALTSREDAETLRGALVGAGVAESELLTINSYRHGDPRQKEFIDNPTGEAAKYRAILYTSTIGTGVDIQAPISGRYLFAGRQPLTGNEIGQLVDRTRAECNTHIWIDPARQAVEELDEKRARMEKGARETANLTGRPFKEVYDEELAALNAHTEHRAEVQRADLLESTLAAIARGFDAVTFADADEERAASARRWWRTVREDRKAAWLALLQTVEALNPADANEEHMTPETVAATTRYRIEQITGETITGHTAERLHTATARGAVYRLAVVLGSFDYAKELDIREIDGQIAPNRMRHNLLQQDYARGLIEALLAVERFDVLALDYDAKAQGRHAYRSSVDAIASHTAAKLASLRIDDAAAAAYLQQAGINADALRLLGWRMDYSDKPRARLKWLLDRMGIKSSAKRIRIPGTDERQQITMIDEDAAREVIAWAVGLLRRWDTAKRESVSTFAYLLPYIRETGQGRTRTTPPDRSRPAAERVAAFVGAAAL
jgi:hypothetical protein